MNMAFRGVRSNCSLFLVTALVAWSGSSPAASKTEVSGYEKRATWSETMLESRAAVQRLAAEQRQKLGNPEKPPVVSGSIAGDGPGQAISASVSGCRWMRLVSVLEQGGGNCHIWGDAKLIAKDGSVTWLSSLKPAVIQVGWGKLELDRNWQSQPLKIGKKQFEHGIWVHANSDVGYALEGKYERFEAWVGMDAARAIGTSRFEVRFEKVEVAPAVWRRMAADFPAHARWFADDAGRNYLSWFDNPRILSLEHAAIGRALGQAGAAADPLRKQFDELRKAKAPADDRRWLDLYVRCCRARDCADAAGRIWINDLRRSLESQASALTGADVAPDDPRWTKLQQRCSRIAGLVETGNPVDVSGMDSSIGVLAQAFGVRLQDAESLKKRAEALTARSRVLFAAAADGDEPASAQIPAVATEIRQLRRSLVTSVRGMSEFLAQPAHVAMVAEWESQFESLQNDLRNREHFAKVAAEVWRPESLVRDSDRDPVDMVLRRTAALAGDLKKTSAAARLAELGVEKELAALEAANAKISPNDTQARFVLFAEACRVRRLAALSNPLLNFDQVLFIKRHRMLYNHMCDQYYGMAATPGGGLYVLEGAFGPNPRVRDVLANALVERGRLKGQKLTGGPTTPPNVRFDGNGNRLGEDTGGGTFLSPDLSYDGKQVLVAFVENRGDPLHRHHTDPAQGHWAEGRCYHVFKVGLDGTHLEQLTDGTWNDFDPCWLPNGRIALITERRGGYLRCGRVCPNYNLYDMAADGSDVNALSFHETNEWHPSVTNDGRIIYTRWDYVDRFGCTAHHPWITTLDGRDSRAVHGNFAKRNARPDMELDNRAIPGSTKFVATAAPHHGQAYGSLVLIDPRVPDDDAMGPVRRITPEIGFPESQGGAEVYGTPWPLSEDYYLCCYDAHMEPKAKGRGRTLPRGDYGLYLVDGFGNKELIYRDAEIACQSPIPVCARPVPPASPEVAKRSRQSDPSQRGAKPASPPEATIAVINVYESLKPWPEGTRIKDLRVLQLLPMSVPSGGLRPHETSLREPSARDSVVPVRYVLGTVPVEEDGSAHFVAPAHRELFFQALDDHGLAVQSMRSATYLQEGERLVCQGCHEPKHRSPHLGGVTPLAMRREPSRPKGDVDGSNPFSYPRLVQPVLDKHCVECHAKLESKTFGLAREPITGHWYASYNNLIRNFAFYDYKDGLRTTPGQFGARASKLYEILQKEHYGVKLSGEEMHRLTLWLDCTSMFYGVYEKDRGEAQLRGEVAFPTLE